MGSLMDAPDDKRARWVTPTLTMIHRCSASAGGPVTGLTEGGHVAAPTVHGLGSSALATSISRTFSFATLSGNAAASS